MHVRFRYLTINCIPRVSAGKVRSLGFRYPQRIVHIASSGVGIPILLIVAPRKQCCPVFLSPPTL